MAPELPEAEYEQLKNFEFRNQIPRLSKADALGALIEKLTSPDVNLSPAQVKHADGSVRYPGLDNHGMGSIFEELVRRFNEENNEEAGEHWTPRDAVRLLFGRLTQTASWGLSALQSLTLGNAFDELSPDEQRSLRNLPARVYYGVNSDEAVALRLLGVPRTAAPALAMGLCGQSRRAASPGSRSAPSSRRERVDEGDGRARGGLPSSLVNHGGRV